MNCIKNAIKMTQKSSQKSGRLFIHKKSLKNKGKIQKMEKKSPHTRECFKMKKKTLKRK